jgi:hypothetical protein
MGENIKVFGQMENNMVKENFFTKKRINGGKVYGMKERESDGLVKMPKIILSD